jgi:hypothetical protein
MSPENRRRVQDAVAAAGDELKDKLPESPDHPNGRNSYAHVWRAIKDHFEKSYKDCDDSQVDAILELIERVKNSNEK